MFLLLALIDLKVKKHGMEMMPAGMRLGKLSLREETETLMK